VFSTFSHTLQRLMANPSRSLFIPRTRNHRQWRFLIPVFFGRDVLKGRLWRKRGMKTLWWIGERYDRFSIGSHEIDVLCTKIKQWCDFIWYCEIKNLVHQSPVVVRLRDAILVFSVPWLEGYLEPDYHSVFLNVPWFKEQVKKQWLITLQMFYKLQYIETQLCTTNSDNH